MRKSSTARLARSERDRNAVEGPFENPLCFLGPTPLATTEPEVHPVGKDVYGELAADTTADKNTNRPKKHQYVMPP